MMFKGSTSSLAPVVIGVSTTTPCQPAAPKVQSVAGGVLIETDLPYDVTYDNVLMHLEEQGYLIYSADRTTGQVVTSMEVRGGYNPAGARIRVVLIKGCATNVTLRVSVLQQKRRKCSSRSRRG